jgi:minor extracellular serine protease Vpr
LATRLYAGAVALLLGLLLLAPATASTRDPKTDATTSRSVGSSYAVVDLTGAPVATYAGNRSGYSRTKPRAGERLKLHSSATRSYKRFLARQRNDFKKWLKRQYPGAEVVDELGIVANAVIVKLNGVRKGVLRAGPHVAYVTTDALYRPTMNVSNDLINSPEVWARLGGPQNAGRGIKVAIIDTGIDLTSPFLSDAGYPDRPEVDACAPHEKPGGENTSNKVIVCRVYTSGKTTARGDELLEFDHGTHVSGTVAGKYGTTGRVVETDVTISGLSGVAPKALLGDYNVFPGFGAGFVAFGGSAFSHDIAEALEDALRDGMDVANMSLGGGVQGPHDFLAEAVNATVEGGMVVAVAAGNSGPGDATVESPGSALRALTAGASTNPHFVGIPVTLRGGATYPAAIGEFNPYIPPVENAQFASTEPADGCAAITNDVDGKIALIDRGTCTFGTKVFNAENAGAIGVIVINNVAGDPTAMAVDESFPEPTIPAAMVSQSAGAELEEKAGKTTMTVDGTQAREFITDNADIAAGFSSRGPAPFTYLIKPDVTAPGVNVLSSVFGGEYAFFNGTSMATPHVAGSSALLIQRHPSWSPDQIKSALVNNAKRPVYDSITGTEPTGVLTRGGGRINVEKADRTPLTIVQPSVSFGYFNGGQRVGSAKTLHVTNVSGIRQTCVVTVVTAEDDEAAVVSASPRVVALDPADSTNVTVTLSGGRAVPTGDYEGDIKFACPSQTLKAPWFVRVNRRG